MRSKSKVRFPFDHFVQFDSHAVLEIAVRTEDRGSITGRAHNSNRRVSRISRRVPQFRADSLCRHASSSEMVGLPLKVAQHNIAISVPPPDSYNSDCAKFSSTVPSFPLRNDSSTAMPAYSHLAFDGFTRPAARNVAVIVPSVRIQSNYPASYREVSWLPEYPLDGLARR